MSEKKSVYKPKEISGFPEWAPEVRLVEQQWFDHIRRVFESYGFCSVETPSVEELAVIEAKGEVDKELYVIERAHKEEGDKEARLALHFDLTVPLARYVAQHFNDLVFPFKRYQMQRVWRGERPQKGRFREFTQCDIDVINIDTLPLHFDAEMPAIISEVLNELPGMKGESFQILISNRKILIGACEFMNISRQNAYTALTIIDKLNKIGSEQVHKLLTDELGLSLNQRNTLANFAQNAVSLVDKEEVSKFFRTARESNIASNQLFNEGLNELEFVANTLLQTSSSHSFGIHLGIVRGLDYYTGTVYETVFTENPGYGSICSGGRYDDLASQYINKKLPGVGISIGFSRLFAYLLEKGKLPIGPKSPADVLMILPSEDMRAQAAAAAQKLRANNVKVELYHAPKKTGDQIKYADRKGIPYVWFPDSGEVKNMKTGEQAKADPEKWQKDSS